MPKPMEFGIATNTSIPNPLMPRAGPPKKPMELDNATAGPVSESLPFTAGLPENLMELDNATTRPVTESLEFNTGPPMEPNAVPGTPIISLQEPAVNTDPLLNSTNMDHETTIPLQEPTIVTAQPVRLEGQPNMFSFGKTQAGTRRKRDGDRRLHRQETNVSYMNNERLIILTVLIAWREGKTCRTGRPTDKDCSSREG